MRTSLLRLLVIVLLGTLLASVLASESEKETPNDKNGSSVATKEPQRSANLSPKNRGGNVAHHTEETASQPLIATADGTDQSKKSDSKAVMKAKSSSRHAKAGSKRPASSGFLSRYVVKHTGRAAFIFFLASSLLLLPAVREKVCRVVPTALGDVIECSARSIYSFIFGGIKASDKSLTTKLHIPRMGLPSQSSFAFFPYMHLGTGIFGLLATLFRDPSNTAPAEFDDDIGKALVETGHVMLSPATPPGNTKATEAETAAKVLPRLDLTSSSAQQSGTTLPVLDVTANLPISPPPSTADGDKLPKGSSAMDVPPQLQTENDVTALGESDKKTANGQQTPVVDGTITTDPDTTATDAATTTTDAAMLMPPPQTRPQDSQLSSSVPDGKSGGESVVIDGEEDYEEEEEEEEEEGGWDRLSNSTPAADSMLLSGELVSVTHPTILPVMGVTPSLLESSPKASSLPSNELLARNSMSLPQPQITGSRPTLTSARGGSGASGNGGRVRVTHSSGKPNTSSKNPQRSTTAITNAKSAHGGDGLGDGKKDDFL